MPESRPIEAQIFDLDALRAFRNLAANQRKLADQEAARRKARSRSVEATALRVCSAPHPLTPAELDRALERALEAEFETEERR